MCRCIGKGCLRVRQHNPDLGAPDCKAPRRRHSASTVATPPRQHDDSPATHSGKVESGQFGKGSPSVLHHLEQRDAEFFDHYAVNLAHLCRSDGRHEIEPNCALNHRRHE
jgi:hypothetical protein